MNLASLLKIDLNKFIENPRFSGIFIRVIKFKTSKENRTQRVRFSLETMRSLQERDAHFVRDVDRWSVMHADRA